MVQYRAGGASSGGAASRLGRLTGLIVATAALLLLSAAPAYAVWTWYPPTPGPGDVIAGTTPVVVSYMSDTPVAIDPTKGTLQVNGVMATPLLSVYDPILDYGTIQFDPTVMGAIPSALLYGTNDVTATAYAVDGDSDSYHWQFSVNVPPTVASVVPAENAFVTNSNAPTITVTVSDPDDATFSAVGGFIMKVDGTNVTPTWNGITKTYTYKRVFPPNPPWTNGTSHTVIFNVQDSAGNIVSKTWSFTVDTSADTVKPTLTDPSPAPGSTTDPKPAFSITVGDNRPGTVTVGFIVDGTLAHSASVSLPSLGSTRAATWTPVSNLSLGAHTFSMEATDAAGNATSTPTWSFTVVDTQAARHTTTTDFATCSACHDKVLTTEHENHGFDCDTCHGGSAPQNVQDAIAANNTACDACHDMAHSHSSFHQGGTGRPDCLQCHSANISDEHENDCAACHESTDPAVVAAIADRRTSCDSCHEPGIHPAGFFSGKTDYYTWLTTPGPRDTGTPLGQVGDNPTNPGVHANYLATTAKCGVCHSVHRAAGTGTKLLPTGNTTCACCHIEGTTITTKLVTWTPYDIYWAPEVDPASPLYPVGGPAWMAATPAQRVAAITNKTAAGGAANGGGPHNDSALDLIADGYWDGTGATPAPSAEIGTRYGCFTRRCHATNPHGADSSKYKIFAAKLLFNEAANTDQEGDGTYGGLDAVWDDMGASDASVERFVANNAGIVSTTSAGDLLVKKTGESAFRALDANETHALVAGLTCGRPSNPSTGEDECHAEASYAIVDKGIKENRNHATGMTGPSAYRTDNTGAEAAGYGGNDNRDSKTGHVAGTFAAVPGEASYAPIAGCVSCHDQTDGANTSFGNFTFPHGQQARGTTNLKLEDGSWNTSATAGGTRARLWMGYGAGAGSDLFTVTDTARKAYDGNCLKCHRDGAGNGIGLTR